MTTEREWLVMSVRQYQKALREQERHHENVIGYMRRNYKNGMSIVELAKISGFSRPTVMKYVQNTTVATVKD